MANVEMMLSVLVISYQHKDYIRRCLESILMQKTIYDYEVIIADDFSTDGTREIIKEYRQKYGDIIKLVLQRKNQGATRNHYYALKMAKGKYIIAIEGDDYWTDVNKLQKQVDFLENYQECVGVFHKCKFVDENDKIINRRYENLYPVKNNYSMKHFEKGILAGQGATFMFRNNMMDYKIIPKLHNMVGDQTIYAVLLAQGQFGFIDEKMSAYRMVRKKGGGNASSIMKYNNYTDITWMYYYNLEKYINKTYNLNASFEISRKVQVCAAYDILKNDFCVKNIVVYFKVLLYTYMTKMKNRYQL